MKGQITVLGAGAWGTVLSKILAENGYTVHLWSYESEVAEQINREHQNVAYLPHIVLPEQVIAYTHPEQAVLGSEAIINVVISRGIRDLLREMPIGVADKPWLSATKGLEPQTGLRISQILLSTGKAKREQLAVLSGPNLASEIALEAPATSVVGAETKEIALYFQSALMRPYFRIYIQPDPIGVELGGALKNIIALAAGICDGLKIGDNGKAALITRGLSEMTRLGVQLGAEAETFSGLSGMGDLVATCASHHSRNRWCGEQLGLGRNLDEIISSTHSVVEGVRTTQAVMDIARKLYLELPITSAVYEILFEGKDPAQQVEQLMSRMARPENVSLAQKKWERSSHL